MSRTLIALGALLVLLGVLWPYLGKLGVGRLPGDIVIEREHVRFYFPIVSGLIASLVISLVLWLINR